MSEEITTEARSARKVLQDVLAAQQAAPIIRKLRPIGLTTPP